MKQLRGLDVVIGMGKRCLRLEDLEGRTCGACGETFRAMQGVMAHQTSSRRCAWYKKGKLRAIYDNSNDEDSDLECEANNSTIGIQNTIREQSIEGHRHR